MESQVFQRVVQTGGVETGTGQVKGSPAERAHRKKRVLGHSHSKWPSRGVEEVAKGQEEQLEKEEEHQPRVVPLKPREEKKMQSFNYT